MRGLGLALVLRAMTTFSKQMSSLTAIHHFAVENVSKQHTRKHRPQQSLSNIFRSVVKIDPLSFLLTPGDISFYCAPLKSSVVNVKEKKLFIYSYTSSASSDYVSSADGIAPSGRLAKM